MTRAPNIPIEKIMTKKSEKEIQKPDVTLRRQFKLVKNEIQLKSSNKSTHAAKMPNEVS